MESLGQGDSADFGLRSRRRVIPMLWRNRKLDDFTAEIEQHIQLEAEDFEEHDIGCHETVTL
jgi:hypothetical protein